ncbi:MAG TPA: NBR1-Ig-like domain-containing protein [Anaerolineaceae bacterium]
MKPRLLFVVLCLTLAALACNMPTAKNSGIATGTPSALDMLTQAAMTAQAGQTPQPTGTGLSSGQGTVIPSDTPAATPTTAASSAPPTATTQPCDAAGFIQDVTIPDGTKMAPGQSFTKTWRLRNNGTCTWNTSYALVFASGDAMGAPAVINFPGSVAPNATVDFSVNMMAPLTPGKYMSNWKLRNSTGVVFGVVGDQPIFVQLEVVAAAPTRTNTPPPTNTQAAPTQVTGLVYDFTVSMCKAEWRSQAGVLACPGVTGDIKGYVQRLQNPTLETGSVETNPVLLTVPENTAPFAITGKYPAFTIQSRYHFQAVVGCVSGASGCAVKYQVNYSTDGTTWTNLGEWTHHYSNSVQGIDIDLSPLAGKTVQIALVVLGDTQNNTVTPTAGQQQAVWVFPRIVQQ